MARHSRLPCKPPTSPRASLRLPAWSAIAVAWTAGRVRGWVGKDSTARARALRGGRGAIERLAWAISNLGYDHASYPQIPQTRQKRSWSAGYRTNTRCLPPKARSRSSVTNRPMISGGLRRVHRPPGPQLTTVAARNNVSASARRLPAVTIYSRAGVILRRKGNG
jgi:hypothetical protein